MTPSVSYTFRFIRSTEIIELLVAGIRLTTYAIFKSRYQIVTKLGYGTASIIWPYRDLEHMLEGCLLALKVCIVGRDIAEANNEVVVSQFLEPIVTGHPGKQLVRLVLDDFEIKELVLIGLDFLQQAGIIPTNSHPDLSPNNILLGVHDSSVFEELEQNELQEPSARKAPLDRIIYLPQLMPVTRGLLVICDFSAAKIGRKHTGDVMPNAYRAPEIIMEMECDSKIDVWSVGIMIWDLFEGGRLLHAKKDGFLNNELHLAEMVSPTGPPLRSFLDRSDNCREYWDEKKRLEDEDQVLLLALARKILRWLPEDRLTARGLFEDKFIVQHRLKD
ncbi:kinase-like domain-containing protein [Xylaria acuta]|nr:kinase-like domain-containing protein [Xylaria acuta]